MLSISLSIFLYDETLPLLILRSGIYSEPKFGHITYFANWAITRMTTSRSLKVLVHTGLPSLAAGNLYPLYKQA